MSDCGGMNCDGGASGGPPKSLPCWFTCPAPSTVKRYTVPKGVEILPITEGGRFGPSKKNKKFMCGACGDQNKSKDIKPKIKKDCPFAKIPPVQGLGGTCNVETCGKGKSEGSFLNKINDFFGIGQKK